MTKIEIVTDRILTPLFIEALAYHEPGHIVMSLVLDIPMRRAAIGDACDVKGYNGIVELESEPRISGLEQALMFLASAESEKVAPNFKRFGRLKGFWIGRHNDRVLAFEAFTRVYKRMCFAESTAKRHFRAQTQPHLLAIMGNKRNQVVVRQVADALILERSMDRETILSFKAGIVKPTNGYHHDTI